MKRRETATAGQQTTHGADDNVDESGPSADFSSTPLASKMKLFSISEEYFGAMPQRRMPQRWISIDKTTHTQKLFKNNCISPLSFFLSFFLIPPLLLLRLLLFWNWKYISFHLFPLVVFLSFSLRNENLRRQRSYFS